MKVIFTFTSICVPYNGNCSDRVEVLGTYYSDPYVFSNREVHFKVWAVYSAVQ